MKELIERLNEVRGNIFNSDNYAGTGRDNEEHDDMQSVLDAIVALEAAEAREAELRARVAELELKLNPPSRYPNSCVSCGAIDGHGGLQCPSYLASLECAS